jgi:hypothetical protein
MIIIIANKVNKVLFYYGNQATKLKKNKIRFFKTIKIAAF